MTLICKNLILKIFIVGLCSMLVGAARCQTLAGPTIDVTMRKTSTILFPVDIKSGDRGSIDIIVQKAKGAQNVLKVKAARKNFPETNLTVITEDGLLHHYLIRFSEEPNKYIFYADSLEGVPLQARVHLSDGDFRRSNAISSSILAQTGSGLVGFYKKNQMRLALRGIYIDGNTLYFHVQIDNKSNIPYDIDLLQFLLRDKQRVKRMASQETIEEPTYVYGSSSVVPGTSGIDVIYALPKFTIPDAKDLVIQLMEKRGGRHLELRVRNRSIIRAEVVPLN